MIKSNKSQVLRLIGYHILVLFMKVFKAKRSVIKGEYNGIEDYLRKEFDLKKEVSLKKIKDGGMHGNRKIVWDTPDGEVKCSGYFSSGMVRTIKMGIVDEENVKKLFGYSFSELLSRRDDAKTGFEDV